MVSLIDEAGKFLGEISFEEAANKAKSVGKSLILLNGKTNTYKIADAGKLKYEQRQQTRHQHLRKTKEIKLRPAIDRHDLEVKINHIRDFLARGLKTKLIMTLRGRQIDHQNLAVQKFNEIPNILVAEGIAALECPTQFNGRELIVLLVPVASF